jgi:hypothetical protein
LPVPPPGAVGEVGGSVVCSGCTGGEFAAVPAPVEGPPGGGATGGAATGGTLAAVGVEVATTGALAPPALDAVEPPAGGTPRLGPALGTETPGIGRWSPPGFTLLAGTLTGGT